MQKGITIVGMGPGLSMGIADKFGQEGFQIGMISRNVNKLSGIREQLAFRLISLLPTWTLFRWESRYPEFNVSTQSHAKE